MDNIFNVNLAGDYLQRGVIGTAYQYDYGHKILFDGIELPSAFEVHFSNDKVTNDAYVVIGQDYEVDIPDVCFRSGKNIYGWLYLHPTAESGQTTYSFEVSVRRRPEPTDEEPTPQEQSTITQTIALLNDAVEDVNALAESIPTTINSALQEAKDSGAFDGQDGYTPQKGIDYFDGQDGYTPVKGVDYFDGAKGDDGYTPVKGVDYFDGEKGDDGISPTVTTSEITGGHSVTITDKSGEHSFNVMDGEDGEDGQDGDDYVLTQSDKQDIADIVVNQVIPKADMIKDTATGDICSFPDGADDMPMGSLKVKIEPNQDLHGYDSPWPAGGGKNLFPPLTPETKNGVTLAISDGVITLNTASNGASEDTYFDMVVSGLNGQSGQDFYLYAFNPASGSSRVSIFIIVSAGNNPQVNLNTVNASYTGVFTNDVTITKVRLRVPSGEVLTNFKVSPYLQFGGSAPTAFSPYENICPITGWTGANVGACGKNLFDKSAITPNSWIAVNTTTIESAQGYFVSDYIPVEVGSPIICTSRGASRSIYYDKAKNPIEYFSWNTNVLNPLYDGYIRVTDTNANLDSLQIELGSTATSYEPYKTKLTSNPLPISWETEAGTVYGGEIDIISGDMVVDKKSILASNTTWSYDSRYSRFQSGYINDRKSGSARVLYINSSSYMPITDGRSIAAVPDCSIYSGGTTDKSVYIHDYRFTDPTDFLNASGNVRIVYAIEPITYHLTPHEVRSLLGQNNIWADTGDCEVSYSCDTKSYIDKKIAEIVTRSTAQTLSSPRLQAVFNQQIPVDETEVTDDEFSE